MSVAITRTEFDAAGLRQAAARAKDADAARRMLALASVLDGRSRTEAAENCDLDRQTLRDCCAAWNALIQQPEQITSIASRDWAQQVKV